MGKLNLEHHKCVSKPANYKIVNRNINKDWNLSLTATKLLKITTKNYQKTSNNHKNYTNIFKRTHKTAMHFSWKNFNVSNLCLSFLVLNISTVYFFLEVFYSLTVCLLYSIFSHSTNLYANYAAELNFCVSVCDCNYLFIFFWT